MDNNELLAQIAQLMDAKLGALSTELRSEMSQIKDDLSVRIDSLSRSAVIVESEMPKVQMVLDQQVDIIHKLDALQHEKAEHQSIRERLSALEGVTKIYTAKVNKLERDTARSAGQSR